jgi:hypothetical protein
LHSPSVFHSLMVRSRDPDTICGRGMRSSTAQPAGRAL